MKLVILESPYKGDINANRNYAHLAVIDCLSRGESPIASHLLYTQMLDDNSIEHRNLGIRAGLAWYRVAEACVVYTDHGVSEGMQQGIDRAKAHGVTIIYRSLITKLEHTIEHA